MKNKLAALLLLLPILVYATDIQVVSNNSGDQASNSYTLLNTNQNLIYNMGLKYPINININGVNSTVYQGSANSVQLSFNREYINVLLDNMDSSQFVIREGFHQNIYWNQNTSSNINVVDSSVPSKNLSISINIINTNDDSDDDSSD